MAITSTDNQTAAAPIAEVPVASKTASPPADEIEPAPTETSKPVEGEPVTTGEKAEKRAVEEIESAEEPAQKKQSPKEKNAPPISVEEAAAAES